MDNKPTKEMLKEMHDIVGTPEMDADFDVSIEDRVKKARPEVESADVASGKEDLDIEGQHTVSISAGRYNRLMRNSSTVKKLFLTHGIWPKDTYKVMIYQLIASLRDDDVPFKVDMKKLNKTRSIKWLAGVYGYLLDRYNNKDRILKYGV
jgi:hypothetical protein